jgi:WD40 repeat protein
MKRSLITTGAMLLLASGAASFVQEPSAPVILQGHDIRFRIAAVAFSPDDKLLASGSHDKTVKLWEVATGAERATLKSHQEAVNCVAFSPDGKTLASGSGDRTVKIWDVATGKEKASLEHSGVLLAVAFSPDGKWLAAADTKEAKIWKTDSWKEQTVFRGHGEGVWVNAVAVAPGDKVVATAGGVLGNGTVTFWDVTSGKEQKVWKVEAAKSLAYSPDGKTLAAACGRFVKFWDAAAGKPKPGEGLDHRAAQALGSLAYSPDGKLLATADPQRWLPGDQRDKQLRVWDVATEKEVFHWGGGTGAGPKGVTGNPGVFAVAFTRDGSKLAAGDGDGLIRLWEVAKLPGQHKEK